MKVLLLALLLSTTQYISASPDTLQYLLDDDDQLALEESYDYNQDDMNLEAVATDQEDDDEDDGDGVLADIEATTMLFDSEKELEKADLKAMVQDENNVAQTQLWGTLFSVGKYFAKRYLKKKYCRNRSRRCNQEEEEEEIEVQDYDFKNNDSESEETRLAQFQSFLESLKQVQGDNKMAKAEFFRRIRRWARKRLRRVRKWASRRLHGARRWAGRRLRGARRWVKRKWNRARNYIKRRARGLLRGGVKRLFRGAVRKWVC